MVMGVKYSVSRFLEIGHHFTVLKEGTRPNAVQRSQNLEDSSPMIFR